MAMHGHEARRDFSLPPSIRSRPRPTIVDEGSAVVASVIFDSDRMGRCFPRLPFPKIEGSSLSGS